MQSPGTAHAADGTWVNPTPQTVALTSDGTTLTYSGADPNNDLVVGDPIRVGSTAVIGLSANSVYFVASKSGNVITLATSPGGSVVATTSTGSPTTLTRSFQWNTGVTGPWASGTVASGTGATAFFTSTNTAPANAVYITTGTTLTIGNIDDSATNTNLQFASSTVSPGTLNFAVNSGTPTITNSGNTGNRNVTFLPASNANLNALKITGTQGLLFNGTGTNTAPHFVIQAGADWTGFSGGYTVQEGVVQIRNGALSSTQSLTLGNGSTGVGKFAQIDMNAGAQTIDALNGTSAGRIYSSNGSRALTIGGANGSGTFAGIIGTKDSATVDANSVQVAVTKNGTGTQILSGANNYTAATTLNAGQLIINGSIASSTTTINGATTVLGGTNGTVGPVIRSATGGIVDPGVGTSIATLNGSSFTWNSSNSNVGAAFELSGAVGAPVKGVDNDLLNLTGTLTKGTAGGTFVIQVLGGVVGQTYELIDFAGGTTFTSGEFTVAPGGDTGGFSFNGGNTALLFTPDSVVAVPEPASLSVVGLVGLGLLRRRVSRR